MMKTNKTGKYMLVTEGPFSGATFKNRLTDFSKCDLEGVNEGFRAFRAIRLFTVLDGKIVRIKANGSKWLK